MANGPHNRSSASDRSNCAWGEKMGGWPLWGASPPGLLFKKNPIPEEGVILNNKGGGVGRGSTLAGFRSFDHTVDLYLSPTMHRCGLCTCFSIKLSTNQTNRHLIEVGKSFISQSHKRDLCFVSGYFFWFKLDLRQHPNFSQALTFAGPCRSTQYFGLHFSQF